MLALIGNLDTTELLVVMVAAILIFGKRLPEVAAQAGAQLGKLRRTLDSAWKEAGVDREVREMQRSIETLRDAVPRDLSPGTLARTAVNEFQRRVEAVQEPATAPEARAELPATTEPRPAVPSESAHATESSSAATGTPPHSAQSPRPADAPHAPDAASLPAPTQPRVVPPGAPE